MRIIVSLLSWERGLKCYPNATTYTAGMSLLSWERGLKSAFEMYKNIVAQSLLSWERGLKFSFSKISDAIGLVAPLVGAWIEIRM